MLRTPRPASGAFRALQAQSIFGMSEEHPTGSLLGRLGPALRSVQKGSGECSGSVQDAFLTLRGHSRHTCRTLWRRAVRHPCFRRCSVRPSGPRTGKEKAHKHKQTFSGDWPGGEGSPDRVGGGSPDRWPGVKSLCAVFGTQGT